MSLTQINDYGIGNVNLTSMMMSMDLQRRDKQAISLTHYDDNLEPKIAAGSIVELGGALLGCDADESITGWAGIGNDNDVYIKIVPSGTTATAVFVTAAPTWSTSKQGWYVGNDRYIFYLYKDAGGNYTKKRLLLPNPDQQIFGDLKHKGDLELDGSVKSHIVTDYILYREKQSSSFTLTESGGWQATGFTITADNGVYEIVVALDNADAAGDYTILGILRFMRHPDTDRSHLVTWEVGTTWTTYFDNGIRVNGTNIEVYYSPDLGGNQDMKGEMSYRKICDVIDAYP